MLNKTFEFLRIADAKPSDEKVRKRQESATNLVNKIVTDGGQDSLLAFLQGVVSGFDKSPFTQDSPAVVVLIKAIKDLDATLPQDVKENAVELRAVAGIVVGELLTHQSEGTPTDQAVMAALSLRSALSLRAAATDKHIRWMLATLLEASDKVLPLAARHRRQHGNVALQQLEEMTEPADDTAVWEAIVPVVKSALQEVNSQAAVDREEIETLWWMFAAYSEVEHKHLANLSSSAAAFCSGLELAQRALLPPSSSAVAMVARAVESGRKPAALGSISLQDATADWSESMLSGLAPTDGSLDDSLSHFPALLPISWTCRRLRECGDSSKLGKEATATTGIPLNQPHPPHEWGAQVFRERILQRVLIRAQES
jgi:hypothetical protein